MIEAFDTKVILLYLLPFIIKKNYNHILLKYKLLIINDLQK
jgi:hypothetical protein